MRLSQIKNLKNQAGIAHFTSILATAAVFVVVGLVVMRSSSAQELVTKNELVNTYSAKFLAPLDKNNEFINGLNGRNLVEEGMYLFGDWAGTVEVARLSSANSKVPKAYLYGGVGGWSGGDIPPTDGTREVCATVRAVDGEAKIKLVGARNKVKSYTLKPYYATNEEGKVYQVPNWHKVCAPNGKSNAERPGYFIRHVSGSEVQILNVEETQTYLY